MRVKLIILLTQCIQWIFRSFSFYSQDHRSIVGRHFDSSSCWEWWEAWLQNIRRHAMHPCSFSCACLVIEHEFRHNIVKVAGDLQTTLTMSWQHTLPITGRHMKTDVNLFFYDIVRSRSLTDSLCSKRFREVQEQRIIAWKKGGGGGEAGGGVRKRLQSNPWILKTAHLAFHAWVISCCHRLS